MAKWKKVNQTQLPDQLPNHCQCESLSPSFGLFQLRASYKTTRADVPRLSVIIFWDTNDQQRSSCFCCVAKKFILLPSALSCSDWIGREHSRPALFGHSCCGSFKTSAVTPVTEQPQSLQKLRVYISVI